MLDIVGRVGVARGFAGPVDHTLQLVEAEQQWRRKQRNTRHLSSPSKAAPASWPKGTSPPIIANMKSTPQLFKVQALTPRYLFDQLVKK
jgi:hypothetical protein